MKKRLWAPNPYLMHTLLCAGITLLPATKVLGQTAAQVLEATGIRSGLCVTLGAVDGALEADLAQNGRLLVHGLALTEKDAEAARKAISGRGLYGQASVEVVASAVTLPYAGNQVNLLIADLGMLGSKAPSDAEIQRVLVPNGIAYVKRGGGWTQQSKPMPPDMDEWPQYYYGPENNPISQDRQVKPPRSLKWLGWYARPNKLGLNGDVAGGHRLAGGRSFSLTMFSTKEGNTNVDRKLLEARDAFNGVLLWSKVLDPKLNSRFPLIATENRVFASLDPSGGPMVALDAATGEQVLQFDKGQKQTPNGYVQPLLVGGTLIQSGGSTLYALDAATGALKWSYTEDGNTPLVSPAADPKTGRVFVVAAKESGKSPSARWLASRAKAVVALKLSDGAKLWRSTEFVGKGGGKVAEPSVGWLVYDNDRIALMSPYGIHAVNADPYLGMLDASNGKLLWANDYQLGQGRAKNYSGYWPSTTTGPTHPKFWGQGLILRDGVAYTTMADMVAAYDINTGKEITSLKFQVPNQRCNRARATRDFFITGFSVFAAPDLKTFEYQNISRGGCAMGIFPAYGQIYAAGNGQCGCFNILRHQMSASPEVPLPPIAKDARLVKGPAFGASSGSPVMATTAPDLGYRVPVSTAKPILDDWLNNDYLATPETPAVIAGGKALVAVTNQHRVEARSLSNQAVMWSYTTDGRISQAPLVLGDLCIVASHDGWVHALRLSDGALAWKFLAARNHRKIMAFSQLESAWPVFGAIVHEGKVCVSAGRHPELDGGILVWGLDPATGAASWETAIRRDSQVRSITDKTERSYVNRILNAPLVAEGMHVKLPGITIDPKNPGSSVRLRAVAGETPQEMPFRVTSSGRGFVLETQVGNAAAEGTLTVEIFDFSGTSMGKHTTYGSRRSYIPVDALGQGRYLLRATLGGRTYSLPVTLKQ